MGIIAKADLKHGAYYEGMCRNAQLARWNAEKQHFVHLRTKFDFRFTETIRHPEDSDGYDTFRPFKETTTPEKEIPFEG